MYVPSSTHVESEKRRIAHIARLPKYCADAPKSVKPPLSEIFSAVKLPMVFSRARVRAVASMQGFRFCGDWQRKMCLSLFCRQYRFPFPPAEITDSLPIPLYPRGIGYIHWKTQKSAQRNFCGNELRRHMICAAITALSPRVKDPKRSGKTKAAPPFGTSAAMRASSI